MSRDEMDLEALRREAAAQDADRLRDAMWPMWKWVADYCACVLANLIVCGVWYSVNPAAASRAFLFVVVGIAFAFCLRAYRENC